MRIKSAIIDLVIIVMIPV